MKNIVTSILIAIVMTVSSQANASGDRIRDTAMGVLAGTLAVQGVNAAVRIMSQPGYSQQYAAPTYYNQQPMYQQPMYQQPMYQQPMYQQPMYQQPMYQQPMYQQPMYQQPMYQAQPRTQVIEHVVYDERPRDNKNWWYYCRSSKTYYPYVKSCKTEWEKVPATPQE